MRAAERAKRKLKRQETKAFCDTLNRSAAAGVCYGRDDEPRLGWMKIAGFAIGTDGTMLALFDDVSGCVESNSGRPTPSTRRRPRDRADAT